MILAILSFVRSLRDAAAHAHGGEYTRGYVDAIAEVEDFITSAMWEDGLDDPEDD
jgi:hypothetical protein